MGLDTGVNKPLWKALKARVNGTPPPDIPLADIHLESLDFWARNDDVRDGTFATLRREAPISFWSPIEYEGFETGNGYWALTKLDDVHFASRHPDIFSSAGGITVNDQTPELAEYFGSMIVLDDPRHQRLRSIVSRAFTPKVVARIEVVGARTRPPAGRSDDRQSSRRASRYRQRAGRATATAGDLRHDGNPRGRPRAGLPLDQRDPRVRRPRPDVGFRGIPSGFDGHRRLRQRAGGGSPRPIPTTI